MSTSYPTDVMFAIEEDDRRAAYRVHPGPEEAPRLRVNDGETEAVPASVADINARGAKLEFQRLVPGQFRPGGRVSITISLPALDEPAEIAAKTVFSILQEEQTITAFLFIELPDSLTEAGADVFSLLNRRKAPRASAADSDLSASLTFNRHAWRDAETKIRVQDLSKTGMRFEIDAIEDGEFQIGDRFDLVMRSSETGDERRYTATIRRRSSGDGKSYYGCELTHAG